jgi:hypothetical protein
MAARIHDNVFKAIFLILLFIVLIFKSVTADAQMYRSDESLYKGFVASFGTRSAILSSDIQKIDQSKITQAGGRIGLVFGNSVVRSRIGLLGYYASTANTAGSVDLYESNATVHFYPLSWITKRSPLVEPYITGGVDYDQYKFYGHYLNQEPGQTNYSQAEAPYLGKIKEVNASIGAGVEVKLKDDYDFIHLFTEVRYGRNLSRKTDDAAFAHTEIARQMQVIIGITFGAHR